jgi:hypothetical protein
VSADGEDVIEYLCIWKGYDEAEATWERITDLTNAKACIADYEAIQQKQQEEQQRLQSSSTRVPISCTMCNKLFYTNTQKYTHAYTEHGVPVPHQQLDSMKITDDVEVFKLLQRKEKEFRVVYASNLGAKEIKMTLYERQYMLSHEFVLSSEGLLYCVDVSALRSRSRVKTQLRLCVPTTERRRLMLQVHNTKLAAHPGVIHMYEKMRETLWWPRMLESIITYVKNCVDCQQGKGGLDTNAPAQPMNIPFAPWSHVAVDHVGPLPTTKNGNKYILIAICRYTKLAEGFAVVDTSTTVTSDTIVKGVVCRHGVMQYLQSDRGSGFVSELANQVYELLGIKHTKTTAYHPQSNGVVEIFNKTLKTTLMLWAHENQDDWDELLPFVVFAYNTAYHTGIQEVPFYLNTGRTARVNTEEIIDKLDHSLPTVHEYASQLVEKLSHTHRRVVELLKQVNEDRVTENDKQVAEYKIGDMVLLFDHTTPVGLSKKLVNRWKGPYEVISKQTPVNYTIMHKGKPRMVHVQRLRLFNTDKTDSDEKYENEMSMAQSEIEALTERITNMTNRLKEVEQQEEKIEAQHQVQSSSSSSSPPSSDVNYVSVEVLDEQAIKWH